MPDPSWLYSWALVIGETGEGAHGPSTTTEVRKVKAALGQPGQRPEPASGDPGSYCPYFHHVVELIGRRWTGVVILALSRSPQRYSRLRQQIPGLSDRLLTERLTELESEGLVDRIEHDGATTYRLSSFGEQLIPVIRSIETFAHTAAERMGELAHPGRRHDDRAV